MSKAKVHMLDTKLEPYYVIEICILIIVQTTLRWATTLDLPTDNK